MVQLHTCMYNCSYIFHFFSHNLQHSITIIIHNNQPSAMINSNINNLLSPSTSDYALSYESDFEQDQISMDSNFESNYFHQEMPVDVNTKDDVQGMLTGPFISYNSSKESLKSIERETFSSTFVEVRLECKKCIQLRYSHIHDSHIAWCFLSFCIIRCQL